jgi:hypothetical protein
MGIPRNGLRVPFIIAGPGLARVVTAACADVSDVMPTLLDLAGVATRSCSTWPPVRPNASIVHELVQPTAHGCAGTETPTPGATVSSSPTGCPATECWRGRPQGTGGRGCVPLAGAGTRAVFSIIASIV